MFPSWHNPRKSVSAEADLSTGGHDHPTSQTLILIYSTTLRTGNQILYRWIEDYINPRVNLDVAANEIFVPLSGNDFWSLTP